MATYFTKKAIPWARISKSQVVRKSPCRTGYIVLLPETVQSLECYDPYESNTSGPPNVLDLNPEKCISVVGQYYLKFESGLWTLEDKLKDGNHQPLNIFKDVLDPLEKLNAPLDVIWGLMKTLFLSKSDIMSEDCYMNIHKRGSLARSQKFNSKAVYEACKSAETSNLSEEQKRVLNKYILEGSLNGLNLNDGDSLKLKDILREINRAKSEFREKVKIATKQFKHQIYDNNIIHDFPQDLLQAMASDRGGPWVVTLQPHIYNQFMEYCPDRNLRWNVWQANSQRSSPEGVKEIETSNVLEELRILRRNQAKLLGFETYAHMSMETKMAGNLEEVEDMLQRLLRKAYPAQQKELEALQVFAEDRGFEGSLQQWDIAYWKRKQLRALYSFDEEVLKDYFPFPHVLGELFALCEELFAVQIVKSDTVKTWHPDVLFYNIMDVKSRSPIASFFMDPYARPGEKMGDSSSASVVGMRNRSTVCNHEPMAALLFNFKPPTDMKPSLLAFRDLHILFEKFGQALQHLLTTANYYEVSGQTNIEWDVVEVCSNFMTHWLYQPHIVERLSCHYETKEHIPNSILNSWEKLPQQLAGYELCQKLYLSALDLQLYSKKTFWLALIRELWPQYFTIPLQKHDAHPCSFTAIFSEEWAAAYYSHLWAKVIAADVFSAFQEVGLDKKDELANVGSRLRSTFLELGGGCHPGEVFRRFRGRDPSPNALLWSLGLKKVPNKTLV